MGLELAARKQSSRAAACLFKFFAPSLVSPLQKNKDRERKYPIHSEPLNGGHRSMEAFEPSNLTKLITIHRQGTKYHIHTETMIFSPHQITSQYSSFEFVH